MPIARDREGRLSANPLFGDAVLPRRMSSDSVEARLQAHGLALPSPPLPRGAYEPVVIHEGYAWVSGMLPFQNGALMAQGLVDRDVSVPQAREAARWAALNGLSALKAAVGSLDRVLRVIRVGVYVASSPGFGGQPEVANGASELLGATFGDAGRHARVSLGTGPLPLGSPVEVEMLFALRRR
jgi:enamine deaminase RidA (YjgF/YER057c/UK114 family)